MVSCVSCVSCVAQVLLEVVRQINANSSKAPRRKLNRTLPFRLFGSRQEETTTFGASAPSTAPSSPPGGGLGSPWSGSVSNPVTTHTSRTQQFAQADDPKAGRALRLSLRAKDSGKEARKKEKEKEKAAKEKGEKKEKGWLKQTQRRAKKKRSSGSNNKKKSGGADDAAKPVGRRKEDMRMLGQRQTMMKLSQRMESMSTIKRPQAPPRPPRHGIDGVGAGAAAGGPPSGAVEEEAPPHMQEAQSFADLATTSARTVIRGFSPEQAYGMLITTSGPAIDVVAEVASKEVRRTTLCCLRAELTALMCVCAVACVSCGRECRKRSQTC
jgi:hypothetical protein